MFTIDLILKYAPMPVSVQRKEKADAQAVLDQLKSLMPAQPPQWVELTCEKQPDKIIAVLSDQISAIIISQKAATASGRTPGFLAANDAQ